jgi:hypothetical protein
VEISHPKAKGAAEAAPPRKDFSPLFLEYQINQGKPESFPDL